MSGGSNHQQRAAVWTASTIGLLSLAAAAASATLLLHRRTKAKQTAEDNDITYVRLTEVDKIFLSPGIAPISTATWFEGDLEEAAIFLQDRVVQMLRANPWLKGKFVKKQGHYHMAYQSDISKIILDDDKAIFQIGRSDDAVHSCAPFKELATSCSSWLLQIMKDSQQPFWKVVLVRCSRHPARFLLLVSMSHVVGDGHTFYSLYNMLIGAGDVSPLIIDRNHSSKEEQERVLGSPEAGIMTSIGLAVSALRGIFLSHIVAPLFCRQDLQVVSRFLLVDAEKIITTKTKLIGKSGTVPFVSTNDIITSWFLRNCQCDTGIMALNFRGRLEDHPNDLAGNYENCLYYHKEDAMNPVLIRKSLQDMKRAVTKDQAVSSLSIALDHFAASTNWASFFGSSTASSLPGCLFLAHLPLINTAWVPSTLTMCVIFQARPNQLGIWIAGTPEKLKHLTNAPFEAEDKFEIPA